jgi:hypothetical protein
MCKFVRTYDAEDVFKLLNFHNLNLILNHPVEIRKQSTLEGTEEHEPKPHNRTLTVPKFNAGLGPTEESIKVFKATDVNEQPAATTRQLREFLLLRGDSERD